MVCQVFEESNAWQCRVWGLRAIGVSILLIQVRLPLRHGVEARESRGPDQETHESKPRVSVSSFGGVEEWRKWV